MTNPASTSPGTVHVLSPEVANQIAAGEVVERPASVVKELVENALDAGADTITVEVLGGGSQLLRVQDNGHGMAEADARLAVTRHATSKLTTASDLLRIGTFGFRGEALPSIGSVSRFTLATATDGSDCGVSIQVEGGSEIVVEPSAPVKGTTVEVKDLFFNTPARRKFLKKPSTELAHIADVITRLALANSHCAFRYMAEGRMVLEVAAQVAFEQDPLPRLAQILGKPIADRLRPLPDDGLARAVSVRGFLGLPPLGERGAKGQYLFVNGRFVRDRTIQHAVNEAYSGQLPKGKQAVVVLFVSVDPGELDVNVHPQKTEVRFVRSGEIYRTVHGALRRGLLEQPIQPVDAESEPGLRRRMLLAAAERQVMSPPLPAQASPEGSSDSTGELAPTEELAPVSTSAWVLKDGPEAAPHLSSPRYHGHSERLLNAFRGVKPTRAETSAAVQLQAATSAVHRSLALGPTETSVAGANTQSFESPALSAQPAEGAGSNTDTGAFAPRYQPVAPAVDVAPSRSSLGDLPFPSDDLSSARRVGVLWSRYLLLEASNTLWLVDLRGVVQRVAEESLAAPSLVAQALLLPLSLSVRDQGRLGVITEHEQSLTEVGFEVRVEDQECVLLAAPAAAQGLPLDELFFEVLETLEREQPAAEVVFRAVREHQRSSGEKRGVPTGPEEIEALLVQWATCTVRDLAPDGRPLMVALNVPQIEQFFRRA
ncbi:MAG: DNA mismatch repair endonuclease MutL [Myxococcales bacterium]|nr:DNA mismatch repair endonuclease MutL [Myxococcales bacterium]